ncbi:hypothetical protein [Streptomyces sp.]|uniref:hypothetical protein n=1 Tax=Streptomyces sp. TaxID=1931 RepID=UPI002811F5BE|nr:hypothetical protein [Streptomyces sp.]
MLAHPAAVSASPARHHRPTGPDSDSDGDSAPPAPTAAHAGTAASRTDDPRTGSGPHRGPRPRAAAGVESGAPAGARLTGGAHRPRTARADVPAPARSGGARSGALRTAPPTRRGPRGTAPIPPHRPSPARRG